MKILDVLSLGAGVQSSCLLLMSAEGFLPKMDAAIFADTQWEPRRVYDHLAFLSDVCVNAGIKLFVATAGNLRKDLLDFWHLRKSADGKRHASIPAFVKNPDGSRGLVNRQCTSTYKIEVVEKVVREQLLDLRRGQHWPKQLAVRMWIGITFDEFRRRRDSQRPALQLHYPFLDVLTRDDPQFLYPRGFTRDDCVTWMLSRGYPMPPRSACIGCPFHSDAEWHSMKTNRPEEFADACEVDRLIRVNDAARNAEVGQLRGQPFLHSSLIPLELVQFDASLDRSELRGMDNECQGMCGV